MKNILKAVSFVFVLFFACTDKGILTDGQRVLDTVEQEFAPDKREAFFQINLTEEQGKWIVRGETNIQSAKDSLLIRLNKLKPLVADSVMVLPGEKNDSAGWALVTISVCNLRSGAGHDEEMVSQATLGTPVRVLKKQSSWYLVQTPDKYISWVDADALVVLSDKKFNEWKNDDRRIYLPSYGTGLHPENNTPVTDLVAGSILQYKGMSGSNCLLAMPDGRLLTVPASDMENFESWMQKDNPSYDELITTAQQFMGRPYLWGGTSTKGIDCSGFVKTVYFLNGIILARDASLQFRHGGLIAPEQGWQSLQTGDLVFFGRKATDEKPAKATHVGMYIGEGEFIHSAGMVKQNSFDPQKNNYSEFRTISWLGGRRLLDSLGQAGIVKVSDHPWY